MTYLMIRRQTIGYCVLGTLKIGRYNNSQIYLLLHMTCKNVKRRNGLIKKIQKRNDSVSFGASAPNCIYKV